MALRFAFLVLLLATSLVAVSSTGDTAAQWALTRYASGDGGLRVCDGLVGDCIDEEDEMGLESESTRRVLRGGRRRYISYGSLNRNRVPCNHRGQSYYNCRSGRARPYHRGCSRITNCQRYIN